MLGRQSPQSQDREAPAGVSVDPALSGRQRSALTVMFLSTGAGLLWFILFGLPLVASVLAALVLAGALLVFVAGTPAWQRVRPLVHAGLVSGALATLAYDVTRLLVVRATAASVDPFEAWRRFGEALVGDRAPAWLRWMSGLAFHAGNGLTFAVAYTFWFGTRGVVAGVAFALVLEGAMLGVYPGWLQVKALSEFTQVSVIGHLAYGSVLGFVARRRLLAGAQQGS